MPSVARVLLVKKGAECDEAADMARGQMSQAIPKTAHDPNYVKGLSAER